MRILHCYAGNLYGGVETLLVGLARRAGGSGLEPEFALCFEGRLGRELREAGGRVGLLGEVRFGRPWTIIRARQRLARLLADRRPDAVICHACWPHALFGPVVRRTGVPAVFWMHDRAEGRHWLERLASRTPPDLVIANSRGTAATLPHLFPGAPVEVLPSMVEPPPQADRAGLRARVRDAIGTPAGTTVVIQACRLEPWKGHAVLLAALGRLRDRPAWEAWIAGGVQRPAEQAYLDRLEADARDLGIAGRVRFLGQRSDVRDLLAAADLCCQPNTGPEPLGLAFVEALYAGLPVVSTRIGGAAEIVDETCGVLVPPGDPAALAEALDALIADPGARARLGGAGPARAAFLCDPAAMLDRLAAILAGVVEAPRGGRPLPATTTP